MTTSYMAHYHIVKPKWRKVTNQHGEVNWTADSLIKCLDMNIYDSSVFGDTIYNTLHGETRESVKTHGGDLGGKDRNGNRWIAAGVGEYDPAVRFKRLKDAKRHVEREYLKALLRCGILRRPK